MDPQTSPSPWIIYDDLAAALRPSHESGACKHITNKTGLQIPLVYQQGCLKINFSGKTEFILKSVGLFLIQLGKRRSQRDSREME